MWTRLAIVCALVATASGEPQRGFWCTSLVTHYGESSVCAREERVCRTLARTAKQFGAEAPRCVRRDIAWATQIQLGAQIREWLLATRAHCEDQRAMLHGTTCRPVY